MSKNKLKIFMAAALLTLSGCSLQKENKITPTSKPVVTVTPTATPAPTATQIPTPTPVFKEVKLPVEYISSLPKYPNGCVCANASMLLKYRGYDLSIEDFTRKYLPEISSIDEYYLMGEWQDVDLVYRHYFVGDPECVESEICYGSVIQDCINQYFDEIGEKNLRCYCIYNGVDDMNFDTVINEVSEGNPVAIWTTKDLQEPQMFKVSGYTCYSPMYSIIIIGYNEQKDTLYAIDSEKGEIECDKQKVKSIYDVFGEGVLIREKTDKYYE